MRKFIFISLLTIGVFVTLTFSTASLQRKVDGNDMFGFPVAFYVRFSEMVSPNPTAEMYRFSYTNLLFDIAIAYIITILISLIYKKLKKNIN